jgi:uncharacterized protein YjbI with pentapeptide repeats
MAKSATAAPRLDPVRLANLDDLDDADLLSGDHCEGRRYTNVQLDGLDLTGITFLECELLSIALNGTQLRGARFTDCRFEELYAPVFSAARSSWRDIELTRTRLGSAEVFDSALQSVHFNGGKLGYVNLRSSKLTDVLISDCIIDELDLSGARGVRVALQNCRIGTLDVTDAVLKDFDLRSSEFSMIRGVGGLKGATVDDYQLNLLAPILAEQLGIRVEG